MEQRGAINEKIANKIEDLSKISSHPYLEGTKFRCHATCRIGQKQLAEDMIDYILDGDSKPVGCTNSEWEDALIKTADIYFERYAQNHPELAKELALV